MFCPNCGKSVPDDARFCDSCGAMLSQPSQPEQPEQPTQADIPEPFTPSWDGVQPAEVPAPKKSHGKLIAGLVVLAVVIIGVVTAGLLTDWFGLASGDPMDVLAEALEEYKDVDSLTFSLGMEAEVEGSPMKANFDFDFDRKNDVALGNVSVNYGGMTMEIPMGYYENNIVMEIMGQRAAIDMSGLMGQMEGQAQAPVSNEEMDTDALIDAVFDALGRQDPFAYGEMTEHVDRDELKACIKKLFETAGTEEWKKEYANFTYEKDGGDKILSYDPDLKEIMKFLIEGIRPAFKDPSDCDEALGELKEDTELDGLRMPFTITVKKDKSIELALTLSGLPEGEEVPTEITIRLSLSNPNKAKVDTDKLKEMLDGAETIPAEQFFGLDALNEMSSAYGSDYNPAPPIDNGGTSDSIVGTWGGYVDMTGVIGESMQDELGGTSSISEPLMMGMTVTFNEDGTGSMAINVEDFVTLVMDSMPEQSGMTREELTSSMGMDDFKFYYELKDGKLYTWDVGEENDRECVLATLVDSKTLILDAEDYTDSDDEEKGILPLVLSRT